MIYQTDLLAAHLLLGSATILGVLVSYGLLIPRSWIGDETSWVVSRLRRVSRFVAQSPWLSLGLVFGLAWSSGAANGIIQLPWPSVNDEFAYLLGAETFSEGRLANPQHTLWHHFETFAVSHDPVYASKYPPASAAFMAIGLLVFGHPWWGQLLCYSLAATAVAWMMRAWLGHRWALLGGVLVALHPVMQHFESYDYNWSNYSWSHSYWGGSATMMGAALLFGGLRRFVRNERARDAWWMALGIALLAFSRPFEGFLATLVAAWVIAAHVRQTRPAWGAFAGRFVLPLLLVGLPSLLFLFHYNEVTTGDSLRLTHQHYADQYGSAAELLIQAPRSLPEYRNREMARFYIEWVRPAFLAQKSSPEHYWVFKAEGVERFLWFYIGFLAPALIGTFSLIHRRWWRVATAFSLLTFGMVFLTFEFHPHYASAAAPFILVLLVGGMAQLFRTTGQYGWIARALVLALVLVGTVPRLFDLPDQNHEVEPTDWPRVRQKIIADLEKLPGDDLVVVTYAPNHSVFREWVKNGADLDGAPVVWARDLGTEESRERLLDYYAERRVWIFHADAVPPSLTRYKRGPSEDTPTGTSEVGARANGEEPQAGA